MSLILNKLLNTIKHPVVKFVEYIGLNHPGTLIKIRYLARFKRLPNLKNPRDLNEKILYLKLFTDTSRWSELADKYKVRNYVESLGLGDTLVKLYGVWYKADDFKLDEMPNSFILKANNGDGSGTNLIINDKSNWKENDLKIIIDGWLKRKNISATSAEPHYDNIEPCIIAEELLPKIKGQTSLLDYKVWCFNGKPYTILTTSNRLKTATHLGCYDLNWNYHPENLIVSKSFPLESKPLNKPDNLDEILRVAEKLAGDFPQVRVDLYSINNKIYFGEMTFTSLGGMMNYYTPEYLLEMGSKIDLNYPNYKNK